MFRVWRSTEGGGDSLDYQGRYSRLVIAEGHRDTPVSAGQPRLPSYLRNLIRYAVRVGILWRLRPIAWRRLCEAKRQTTTVP